jgi:hypothetical protein
MTKSKGIGRGNGQLKGKDNPNWKGNNVCASKLGRFIG